MKRKLNILAGDTALWVIFILLSVISLIAVYSTIGLSANTTMSMVATTYLVIIAMSHATTADFRVPPCGSI